MSIATVPVEMTREQMYELMVQITMLDHIDGISLVTQEERPELVSLLSTLITSQHITLDEIEQARTRQAEEEAKETNEITG